MQTLNKYKAQSQHTRPKIIYKAHNSHKAQIKFFSYKICGQIKYKFSL